MESKKSTFTGSNWGLIWRNVVTACGSVYTLGIALPWLLSWYNKWYWSNILIDDQKCAFTGDGSNLLFVWAYIGLAIITLGIAPIFMQAWMMRKYYAFVHFSNETEKSEKIETLVMLKQLYDDAVIDKDTYEKQKKELMEDK